MECLDHEIKRVRTKNEQLWVKITSLRSAQSPLSMTQATYSPVTGTGVPPRAQYMSPVPSSVPLPGHYSPNVVPHGMAASQAASSGQNGHMPVYGYVEPLPDHQYHGSAQQAGGMALFWPPNVMQLGPPLAQGTDIQSQPVVTTTVMMTYS